MSATAVVFISKKASSPCATQEKVTVAPIGTVWFAGSSIILAAVQIKIKQKIVLMLRSNIVMYIEKNKKQTKKNK